MLKRDAFFVLILWVGACFASTASAEQYYVSPEGDDRNPGTSATSPWRTIAKANRAVAPGDVVHLRGGVYVDDPIRPARSGSPGAPIRYQGYQGEKPVLSSDSVRGLNVAIDLSERSHISLDGIGVDGMGPRPNARVDQFVELLGGSHNTIANGTFRHAHGWAGFRLDEDAHHNRILNNVIDVVGAYDNGASEDAGDSMQIKDGAHHNLIQGNTITRGGHNVLQVRGEFNIIRGNVFENDWSEIAGPGKGGRNVEVIGRYNLFESNIVRNAKGSSDNPANAGMKVEGRSNIVRRNFIYGNSNEAITSTSRAAQKWAHDNHIFHNTLYSNDGPAWRLRFYDGGNGTSSNIFKNNIVYDNGAGSGDEVEIAFDLAENPGGVIGDSLVEGNLMATRSGGEVAVQIDSGGGRKMLNELEQGFTANFKGNLTATPTFVSGDPRQPADFALAPGSPGIDEGVPLTHTVRSGSGSVIHVRDAGYFSDGFSLVSGDRIQVDGGPVLQVVDVDYSADTLTVSESTEWSADAPVVLEFRGSGPDIGAYEAGLGAGGPRRPQPPRRFSTRLP